EVQRRPDLFSTLRVLVDRKDNASRFLILGSASRDLLRQGSESLAGRIHYLPVGPFDLSEVGNANVERLWLRGGFPRSYLAENDRDSAVWRQDYVSTYLERDLPSLGFQIPPEQIRRCWLMLANSHGQIFNSSEIAGSLGVSGHTVSRYLDILTGTFMIRRL